MHLMTTDVPLVLEIDVGELLPAMVAHDKAGVQFVNGPKRGNRRSGTAFMLYGDRPLRHRWFSNRVHDLGGGNGSL
jgi:hypothetical protein